MLFFLIVKQFFCFTGPGIPSGTCENNESHSLENCRVKILVLEFESLSQSDSGKANF
jgi:hypothetical protein